MNEITKLIEQVRAKETELRLMEQKLAAAVAAAVSSPGDELIPFRPTAKAPVSGTVRDRVIAEIQENGPARAPDISHRLGISLQHAAGILAECAQLRLLVRLSRGLYGAPGAK